MALTLSNPSAAALSTTRTAHSSPPSSWALLGHDTTVLGATSLTRERDGIDLFATCDASGRLLVWQYDAEGSAATDEDHLGGAESAPCRNVCAMHTGGPAVTDVCFTTNASLLLAAAQGNHEVSLWDVSVGECVGIAHRRGGPPRHGAAGTLTDRYDDPPPTAPRRRRTRSGKRTAAGSGLSSSSPSTSAFPVLNAITALPSGSPTLCVGGDDGHLAIFDVRTLRAERSVPLGVPLTAVAGAGVHSRGDHIYVGDACGEVRWIDLRGTAALPALAHISLGKSVVTDLLVSPLQNSTTLPSSALVAITSEVAAHNTNYSDGVGGRPVATWLDMRPFAATDSERIQSRLELWREGAGRSSQPYLWRGDWLHSGHLAFPLGPQTPSPSHRGAADETGDAEEVVESAPALQLVRGDAANWLAAGAWRRFRAKAPPLPPSSDTETGRSPRADRRVTCAVADGAVVLATSGSALMLHQVRTAA